MLIRYGYEITVTCAAAHGDGLPAVGKRRSEGRHSRARKGVYDARSSRRRPMSTRSAIAVADWWRLPATSQFGATPRSKTTARLILRTLAQRKFPSPELPDSCLLYLMGSRYCETDKLSQTAWDLFGKVSPGWGRVQAVCDFVHRHIKFDYMQARATRTAFEAFEERIGVCRDFAHLAVDALPLPQHSGPLRQRPSRRHWRARRRPDGFQRLDRGVSRRELVDFRSSQQHPADRQDRGRARPGRGGYPA